MKLLLQECVVRGKQIQIPLFDDNPPIQTRTWSNFIQTTLPPEIPQFPRPNDGVDGVKTGELLQWQAPLATAFDLPAGRRIGFDREWR